MKALRLLTLAATLLASRGLAVDFAGCFAAANYQPGKNGVVLFKPYDLYTLTSVDPIAAHLKAIGAQLAANGIKLVTLITPPRVLSLPPADPGVSAQQIETMRANYRALLAGVNTLGIATVDLSDVRVYKGEHNAFYLKSDYYWSQEGARFAAGIAADTIRRS